MPLLVTTAKSSMEGFFESIGTSSREVFGDLGHQLSGAILGFQSLGDAIRNVVARLADQALNALFNIGFKALGIPGFATGTNFAPGGLALVGERGPELVNLPRGSQVIPNHDLVGSQQVHKPTFVFPGVTNERMAREAAGQAARRYRQEMNGPLRRAS
jgi:phage-related minor tail protein